MVIIRVDFLRGVYVAAEPTAMSSPEWPPAPARLFAALVSTAYAIGVDPAPLAELESPPELAFGRALSAPGAQYYTPAAYIKGGKSKRPNTEIRRPQMVGIDAPVYYMWNVDLDQAWLLPVLKAVTYLGRAESTVRVSLAETTPDGLPQRLAPDQEGAELLRVPERGWLAALQASYGTQQRIGASYVGYSDPRLAAAPSPWGELFVLRPNAAGKLTDAVTLGNALRAATMSCAPEPIPSVLHGHGKCPHAAWVTLPNVVHEHADGRVLGIGMLLPRGLSESERTVAVWALSRVQRIAANPQMAVRRPSSHEPQPRGIARRTWAKPSRTWATVTPVVLERHPRRTQSVQEVIADTCERWGYPRPSAVEVSQESPLRGVPPARRFKPKRPGRWTHAVLRWEEPVSGPLLLGRDQHFGLGLCHRLSREP
jgi:CRISPR-associated protein Csb2